MPGWRNRSPSPYSMGAALEALRRWRYEAVHASGRVFAVSGMRARLDFAPGPAVAPAERVVPAEPAAPAERVVVAERVVPAP
jgi:nucleoid-associated protein YgaU